MITGIGTDICSITRIAHVLNKFPLRFPARILTKNEQTLWEKKHKDPAWFSKRFAAKEAVSKALGTGFRHGLSFQDFEVSNKKDGAPQIALSVKAASFLPQGVKIHLSLSDEKGYALAFCVVEKM